METNRRDQFETLLNEFRAIADAMQTEPTDWQWVGPHLSQRMFGITARRAKDYAARFGGRAEQMVGGAR